MTYRVIFAGGMAANVESDNIQKTIEEMKANKLIVVDYKKIGE